MKATHRVSAVYYSEKNEVDLSWEDLGTKESVKITASITKIDGERIARIFPACVYVGAVSESFDDGKLEDLIKRMDHHIRQMAPHVKQRKTALLLIEAVLALKERGNEGNNTI